MKNLYNRFIQFIRFKKMPQLVSIAFLLITSSVIIFYQKFISIDQFFVLAVLAVATIGRTKEFIWDWLPFLILFSVYLGLKGYIGLINDTVYIHPMIVADEFLFRELPVVRFQKIFWNPGIVSILDIVATFLYVSHYIVAFYYAFLLWLNNKQKFYTFTASILTLSYLAFITYAIFPAMPPWMAAQQGYIPHVEKIMISVFDLLPGSVGLMNIYAFFGVNLVAAVPSLHAAYPVLLLLFWWKRLSLRVAGLIYTAAVWFIIIYLGEHYVIDAFLGGAYAYVTFVIVRKFQCIKIVNNIKPKRL